MASDHRAAGSGAGVVQNGYSLGLKGYGQNLSAYTSLQSTNAILYVLPWLLCEVIANTCL